MSSAPITDRISAITNQIKDTIVATSTSKDQSIQKSVMSTDYKFAGWMGLDKESAKGNMVWQEYEPKTWTENDVDIKITHCGICGSDLHTLRSGWGASIYPCCVGHEIVGEAVKVGSNVKHIKVGDRCGVGAQSSSCNEDDCPECSSDNQNYCQRANVGTYNGKYKDGSKSYGGYADYNRAPGSHVIKIPDGLSSAEAAPMLCGGVTVWNPLVTNGCGPGKTVGIIGVGGLGHFGIMWAKALGADKVVAISRTRAKEADAKKLGADELIATDEDDKWAKKNANTLDIIVCTVSSPKMPLTGYFQLLKVHGNLIQVGAPEEPLPSFSPFSLLMKGAKFGGSGIGSPKMIKEMLDFAAEKKLHPMIEERDMKDANQAIVDMEDNKARYRYVLVNKHHL